MVSIPVPVPLTFAVPIPIALSLPIPIPVAFAVPVPVALAPRNGRPGEWRGPALRPEDALCHGRLTVVALAFGDGLAAVCFVRICLRATASPAASAASVGSLTSRTVPPAVAVSVHRGPVTAPLAVPFNVLLSLLEASDELVEDGSPSIFGCDGLEFVASRKPRTDLLVRVLYREWRVNVLEVRPQVVRSTSLLSLSMTVIIRTLGRLLLDLFDVSLGTLCLQRTRKANIPVGR